MEQEKENIDKDKRRESLSVCHKKIFKCEMQNVFLLK